jgi:hypothetical protein
MSFVESLINIMVGLGVAMVANAIILPLLGFPISFSQNAIIAAFMTVVSIARSYALRRLFEALHIRNPLSSGALAIVAERRRQIEMEGRTIEHDLDHERGELARAGAAYLLLAGDRPTQASNAWPWHREDLKAKEFRKNIVRGCALGLAELDRQDADRKQKGRANA